MHLKRKEPTEYTGPEQYVADKVCSNTTHSYQSYAESVCSSYLKLHKPIDLSFIPNQKALCLNINDQGDDRELSMQILKEVTKMVPESKQAHKETLESLAEMISKRQAEVDKSMFDLVNSMNDNLENRLQRKIDNLESTMEVFSRKIGKMADVLHSLEKMTKQANAEKKKLKEKKEKEKRKSSSARRKMVRAGSWTSKSDKVPVSPRAPMATASPRKKSATTIVRDDNKDTTAQNLNADNPTTDKPAETKRVPNLKAAMRSRIVKPSPETKEEEATKREEGRVTPRRKKRVTYFDEATKESTTTQEPKKKTEEEPTEESSSSSSEEEEEPTASSSSASTSGDEECILTTAQAEHEGFIEIKPRVNVYL